MFATMHLWWAEDPGVPSFINRFDDIQNMANPASLPITYNCLAAMATSDLLSEKSFPNDHPSWDGLVSSAQTWTNWKLKFPPLHSAMERELRAYSQLRDSFESSNLAMAARGINAALPTHPTTG